MSGAPTPADVALAREWYEQCIEGPATAGDCHGLPLSFRHAGRDYLSALRDWTAERERTDAEGGQRVVLRCTDPRSGLQLRMEVTQYADFPAVEWVCSFTNTGSADTEIISDILPLDMVLPCAKEQVCRLHHARGSDCKLDDFAPLVTELGVPSRAQLAPVAGRSSNGTLPFFNLELGDHGVIGAVGWTGGWFAGFEREEEGVLRVRAGMPRTHLRLHPGEEIRTPRILLLFWHGERLHGHNMLRQFILAHHTPRIDGQLLQAPDCYAVWGENLAANQIAKARWLADNKIPMDVFWIDAGWHGDGQFLEGSTVFNSEWWRHVGNWWPNKTTYPGGLKPIGDVLRELGLGFLLWMEPERVFRDTYFSREHPEWLLGPVGDNWLFNLGDPAAREALTDLISDLIAESGITWYRQDFNMDPAPFWEAADAPDRVGISEIKHITGLYAFWDALRSRHPGLLIDNCSSGGRRIDLETISRSIPLWRSDFQCYPGFDPIAMQGQTHGLALWVPLSTGCCEQPTEYSLRSAMGPGIVFSSNQFEAGPSEHFPHDWLREAVMEQHELRPFFYGDFYPLLSYSLSDEAWAAWQFHRPDLGQGMLLALRRPNSPYTRMEMKLHGLAADAAYTIGPRGDHAQQTMSGAELMAEGIEVEIAHRPGTALYLYSRL